MAGRNVDVLRSHVAEAQARANHIVDEFESMLMVTGGHSMKEVMHIQSQAGLVSNSPPAAKTLVGCHGPHTLASVHSTALCDVKVKVPLQCTNTAMQVLHKRPAADMTHVASAETAALSLDDDTAVYTRWHNMSRLFIINLPMQPHCL